MPKRVILSSGQVNRYGYRILPEGIKFDNYLNNPVLLVEHSHRTLSIGKLKDIKIENGQLTAEPEFDEADELAKEIKRKFEKGYMNAVSIWHDPITISDDPQYLIQGQTRATVLETELLEVSFVNVPGDPGAHALSAGKEVIIPKLNISKNKSEKMELTKAEKKLRKSLGLPETATAEEVDAAISSIEDKQKEALAVKVDALMQLGKQKGFITDENLDKYSKLAAADYDTVKQLIDTHKKEDTEQQLSIAELLKKAGQHNSGGDQKEEKETFEYLQMNDPKKLLEIKQNEPEKYQKLVAGYKGKKFA